MTESISILTPEQIVAEANQPGLFTYSLDRYERRFDNYGEHARRMHQEEALEDAAKVVESLRAAGLMKSGNERTSPPPKELSPESREKIDSLIAESRAAHDELVMAAMEIGWATDGFLSTAVRHALEHQRRLTLQRDSARIAVEKIQTSIPSVLRDVMQHDSFESVRRAINEKIQALVNKEVNRAAHDRYKNLAFSFITEEIPVIKDADNE